MSTISDAWQAGIDAVVADNTLNRGGFVDAIQTVITDGFSNSEGNAWVDAIATELERVGIINNPTYNNLRGTIIADPVAHRALFDALQLSIGQLPESEPAIEALELTNLRDERDNADAAQDRLQELIDAEPAGTIGRLVKGVLRDGKQLLAGHKRDLRDRIRNLTGDPDS